MNARKKSKAALKLEEKESLGNKIKAHISVKYLGVRKHVVEDLVFNLSVSQDEILRHLRDKYVENKKVDYVVCNVYDMHAQDQPLIACRINVHRNLQMRDRVQKQRAQASSVVDKV